MKRKSKIKPLSRRKALAMIDAFTRVPSDIEILRREIWKVKREMAAMAIDVKAIDKRFREKKVFLV